MRAHESIARHHRTRLPSERSFGALLASALVLAAYWPLLRGDGVRWWVLAAALGIALVAIIRPSWLNPPLRAWMQLGSLLGRVVHPIVVAILFFAIITPAAWIMRAIGRDPMRRGFEPGQQSYWVKRDAPASAMHEQF